MDVSATLETSKKVPLEDLSKEDLVKKCKGLLTIAQKAKQVRDATLEENNLLKAKLDEKHTTFNGASEEIIESLTQQKLNLVTTIEDLKHQNSILRNKLKSCESNLGETLNKNSELDIENQGYKRQVKRLTDENEELINQLDDMEKQINQLKNVEVQQQQSNNALKEANLILQNNLVSEKEKALKQVTEISDLQKMLSVSLEEIKKLQSENASIKDSANKDDKSDLLEETNKLKQNLVELETSNTNYLQQIQDKNKKIEQFVNSTDDLNVELHKNRAVIEKLKQDLSNTKTKLSDNQIISSGVTTDLQHSNEKLKEKLKFYHSKLVKFAGDVKLLKQDKNVLIMNFKEYTDQVILWKTQLESFAEKLSEQLKEIEIEKEKLQNKLINSQKEIINLKEINEGLNSEKEKLLEEIRSLEINEDHSSEIEALRNNNKELKEQLNVLIKETEELKNNLKEITFERDTLNEKLKEESEINCQQTQKGLDDCNNEIKKLRAIIHTMELREKDINKAFCQEKEIILTENNILTEKLKQLEDINGNLKNENCDFQEELNNAELKRRDSENEISKLKQKIEELNKQIESLSQQNAEFSEAEKKITKLEKDLEDKDTNFEKIKSLILDDTDADFGKLINRIQVILHENSEIAQLKTTIETFQQNEKGMSDELVKEKESFQSQINQLNEKLYILESVNKDFTVTNKELQDLTQKLQTDHDSCILELKGKEAKIKEMESQILEIKEEIQKQKELLEAAKVSHNNETFKLSKECENFAEIIKNLETDLKNVLQEKNKYESIVNDLTKRLESARAVETQLAEQSSQEIIKLVQQNKELTEKNNSLNDQLALLLNKTKEDTSIQTEDDEKPLSQYEEQINLLKRENSELLAEMNEMNQVLKERGEMISQQQAYCDEIVKKIQVYETQANKNISNIALKEETIKNLEEEIKNIKMGKTDGPDLQSVIDQKDEEISRLQNQIEQLSEKLNRSDISQDAGYAESETMSTSTISRTEEISRLKDLEGSWEERYGKLRNLALKLKGKIRELTTELTKEQTDKADIQQKFANSTKTIKTLQTKCDKLEDDLETSKSECKTYIKKLDSVALDISKDKQTLAANEETISKLKSEIEQLNQNKASVENWKKQVSAKVQTLKKELEANNVLKKDFESRIATLQSELEAKDQALKSEIEKHKQTKNSLQESNNECKKKSVLSLEMQDYERSVKELSQKLENKQELITQLENQIESQKSTISALREQNKLVEERTENQETDMNNLRAEIVASKKKITELQDTLSQKEEKIAIITQSLEEARSENEELSTELSKVIAEHQKNYNILKSEKDHFRNQNLGLEQKLRDVQDALNLKEHQLEALEAEHQAYKVRAQSVLRQNQTRDVGLEEKLNEEVASLKAQLMTVARDLDEQKSTVEQLNRENERLKKDSEDLRKQKDSLELKLQEQIEEYGQLKSKYQQAVAEHIESVRSLKLHAETLSQCYRQQLSEQEVRHNREIIELQSKLVKPPSPTEPPPSMLPSMRREEGEGSESVESIPSPSVHPIPLERLLNNDSDQELTFVKKQLAENESKVAHLTELLADTEQDLAKHVQMNKLLKEEIRRQQRSVEREKHAENLEYLKNIVFKFVTLSNGDERLRLVPVLNTILKLSPEESNRLNMVAKGEVGGKGWTNYLPLSWSSPNKPQ